MILNQDKTTVTISVKRGATFSVRWFFAKLFLAAAGFVSPFDMTLAVGEEES